MHPPRWHQTALNGGPSFTQSFSATTNQITGYNYDAAGNMWGDGVYTYTYDAEGNVLTVSGNDTSASYVYDAQNHRARVQTCSTANEFLVDFAGRQISTWNPATKMGNEGRIYWDGKQIAYRAADGTTYFEHQDYLGTERVRTNAAGSEVGIFQSLPWGDGYTAVNVSDDGGEDTLHFAGLDLDVDGTSHAQFRNYSSAQGRWLAPDPYGGSYDLTNPQSLNRYLYAQNNPLTFTDPTGQDGVSPIGGGVTGYGCGAAAAEGGLNPFADIWCGVGLFKILDGIFGGPKFHGTLAPRPGAGNPDWGDDPGSFGESLGIGSNLKTGSWGIAPALGLPDAGCEFGPCGPGASTFSQGPGAIALGGAATIGCVLAEPCGAVEGILAGIAVIGTAIGVQDVISQISHHDTDFSDDPACHAQYVKDVAYCKKLPRPETRAACYAQAAERLASCNAGRSTPPLPF